MNIIQTICKLEMIFDSMEHVLIHLQFEAKVEGFV